MGIAHFDFKVAHKGGEPYRVCGSAIERCVVQNRGTHLCPRCQPLSHGPLT
jgi:formamidopyrimidine-DNA glycosylase